jgi:hypothetical protein
MKSWSALLLSGVAVSLVMAAPGPTGPAEETLKDRAGYIPQRKYQALPGKMIGVMVPDVAKVMGQEGRSGPPDATAFSSGGGSYRWVYVPAPKGNALITKLQVQIGEKGGNVKVYPALNIANPNTLKDLWNVTTPYALVEVEVNDKLGSPADEGFVATNVTVLDGTKEYPIKISEAVADAKKRYQTWIKDHQQEIDEALTKIQKDALKDQKATGPKETEELMHVSWLPESNSLRVRFSTRITDRSKAGTRQSDAPARIRGPSSLARRTDVFLPALQRKCMNQVMHLSMTLFTRGLSDATMTVEVFPCRNRRQ